MCTQCDNVLKFEIPNPSKSERKVIKRKNCDMKTNSEDEDSIENDFKKIERYMNTMMYIYKIFINGFFQFY